MRRKMRDSGRRANDSRGMKRFLVTFATFFGAGNLPYGPGTWGTLATLPLAAAFMAAGPLWHMIGIVILFPIALVACETYEQQAGTHDSKNIVIDEVLGFLITMVWLPLTWQSFVAGFIVFRVLDIFKPWPISYLDKNVKRGLGVMIDDIAAGIVGNIILQYVASHTVWLGYQTLVISGT